MMSCWRSLLLVLFVALGLWLGSPVQAASLPPQVQELEQQVSQLQRLVDAEDWLEIRSYIHGPMGLTRKNLTGLAVTLPKEQKQEVIRLTKELGQSLEKLDFAAKGYDQPEVEAAQAKVKKALDRLEALFS
ncbi:photosystem II protein PsbQ [Thermostichus vulcanus]|uniref:Photosystem II protein PsbQ n=1 Tax=Thermostichus vulcanus str. 'Rupite' TaxID=2813851 RepID=A0ABT0C8W4_THEVL|nr:photosystem II protein PsbQ [Thermostichus vulcanus]MCJ2542229.1 photosystem II protein PsbQ [Thermostichus vulcanus str. 'Rupite']